MPQFVFERRYKFLSAFANILPALARHLFVTTIHQGRIERAWLKFNENSNERCVLRIEKKEKKKKKKNAGRVIENEILLSSIYNFCMYSYAATCFAVCVPFSSFYIFSFIFYFWSDLSLKQDRKSTIILLQPITL